MNKYNNPEITIVINKILFVLLNGLHNQYKTEYADIVDNNTDRGIFVSSETIPKVLNK